MSVSFKHDFIMHNLRNVRRGVPTYAKIISLYGTLYSCCTKMLRMREKTRCILFLADHDHSGRICEGETAGAGAGAAGGRGGRLHF